MVWIRNSLSPQEFRDRLLSDCQFEEKVIAWLESCHTGDYAVSTDRGLAEELEEEYIDNRWGSGRVQTRLRTGVRDPATELPLTPPAADADDREWEKWEKAMLQDVDRVLFVSNRHDKNHAVLVLIATCSPCKYTIM